MDRSAPRPRASTQSLAVFCWALFALAFAPVASAGSPPFPVKLTVTSMTSSGAPQVRVAVHSAAHVRCTLQVRAPGTTRTLPATWTDAGGGALWVWTPRGLRNDAPWRFTVTCRRGHEWSAHWVPVEPGIPSPVGALAGDRSVTAGTPGASCDTQGLCFTGDPFPAGQCTWFAEGRRPDLLGIVVGNAGEWLNAARGRVPEGWFPVVGSVAVWLANRGGAGAEGHVGYVAAVSGGRILVYDSNWRVTATSPGFEVHEHWVPTISPSGFIYGGPAGAGPTA